MASTLMLLMLLQPALVFSAQGCQTDASSMAMQDHDHGAMDMAEETGGQDGCDCGCYCGGVCVHGCSVSAVTGVLSSGVQSVMQSPVRYSKTFLLPAHPSRYLRPPNHA